MDCSHEERDLLVCFGITLAVAMAEKADVLMMLLFNSYDSLGPLLGALTHRRELVRISGFAENVVPRYHPDDFKRHFRVSRRTFDLLVTALGHCTNIPKPTDCRRGGRVPVTVEKQLLLTLWMLSSQETIRSMGDRFGVCNASVYRIVKRVISAINVNWTSKVISWPSNGSVTHVTDGFFGRRGLQGAVLGAIDGSHVPIKAPGTHQDVYINRKGFHSVVIQAVCNHRMFFTDCFVGYPGSTHDARVMKNSNLYVRVVESVDSTFPNASYLLGDSAYPLSSWLMTPYRDNGHLTAKQKNYNFLHSSTRMVIERAFALLKGRFRRLKYVDMDRLEDLPDMVLAACTLHNICIMSEDDIDDFLNEDGDDGHDYVCGRSDETVDNGDDDDAGFEDVVQTGCSSRNVAKRKRDLIAEQL